MAIKTIGGLLPIWYTLSSDPETRFQLKPLAEVDKLNLRTEYDEKHQTVTGTGVLEAVQASIIGGEGVNDPAGKPLPYSRAEVASLPAAVLAEIGAKILALSFATEDERKN